MKTTWYKKMFVLFKKLFIGLLTGLINGSNHANSVSLSNQKRIKNKLEESTYSY